MPVDKLMTVGIWPDRYLGSHKISVCVCMCVWWHLNVRVCVCVNICEFVLIHMRELLMSRITILKSLGILKNVICPLPVQSFSQRERERGLILCYVILLKWTVQFTVRWQRCFIYELSRKSFVQIHLKCIPNVMFIDAGVCFMNCK